MYFITTPLITGIIFYFTYMVFELFVRRKERLLLLEKMGQNLTPPDPSILRNHLSSLLPSFPKKSFTGLRTGCLLLGLGLGLFVGLIICVNLSYIDRIGQNHWERDTFYSIAYGSSVLFFGGLGLIISYIIESKSAKKDEK
ncbi:MAG: hypothetical protein LBC19_12130 [Tannerella sp.]|jgi:hypothetical protein|nr:hypothetical protein [Tannerella sp.]